MRNLVKILTIFFLVGSIVGCKVNIEKAYKYEYLYADIPFNMPRIMPPLIPEFRVSVTDFGGIGNGQHKNTDAFSRAMAALSEKGGGTLYVPQGVWFTGPIVFQSNINLYIEKGALILFSPDFDDYPIVETIFEGLNTKRCQSPISGRGLKNIAITGLGTIDGSGHAWRPVKKEKVTERQWRKITSGGGAFKRDDYWFPTEKALRGDAISDMNVPRNLNSTEEWNSVKDFLRPVMISFIECENILLEGVTFSNSPSWNLHPLMCENLIIDNISVRNPSYAQNGDGLDLESCKNSIIVNSSFDVGDDGICIKSGKDEDGRRRARPTENVIIDNCKVFKGHGGFVVGSEMSGGVRNIIVRNCEFLGTDVGLRFKSRRGRGGVVENIYVENITMNDIITDSFLFDLYYGGKSASESLEDGGMPVLSDMVIPPVTEETPIFRNLHFQNIVSTNTRRAMFFNGLPEMSIQGISIENVFISSLLGAEFSESEDISFQNVTIFPRIGAVLILRNVKNIRITEFNYPDSLNQVAMVEGSRTRSIIGLFNSVLNEKVSFSDDFDMEQIK